MRRLGLLLALCLSASTVAAQPVRPVPYWLRFHMPIRPQLIPGSPFGGVSGGGGGGAANPALNASQTPDTYYFSTNPLGNSLILAEAADSAFDFAHPQQTNPTIFVHSAAQSTTQWASMAHDGTRALFTSGTGTMFFTVNGLTHFVVTDSNNQSWAPINLGTNALSGATSPGAAADTSISRLSAGVWQTNDRIAYTGTAPTVSACGTTPSAVTGSSTAGFLTTGSGGTVQSCTLTFPVAFATKPACVCNNETVIILLRAISTTTTLVCDAAVAGTMESDVINYSCIEGS